MHRDATHSKFEGFKSESQMIVIRDQSFSRFNIFKCLGNGVVPYHYNPFD